MEKVSIIVPVYNAEKFVSKTINSIIEQDYRPIEIILIDDGSMDKSFEICLKFSKKNSDIIAIHQENSGPGAAKNKGLSIATGRYVLFLDCDDMLTSNAISNLVNEIKKTNADMVIPDRYNVIDEQDNFLCEKFHFNYKMKLSNPIEFATKVMMGYGRGWRAHSLLFNYKSIIDNHISFINRSLVDDFFFNLKCMEYFKKIVFLDKSTVNYRKRNGSITMSFYDNWMEMIWKFHNAGEKYLDSMHLNKKDNEKYVYSMTIRTTINYLIDIFSNKNDLSILKRIKLANEIFNNEKIINIYKDGTSNYIEFPRKIVTIYYRLIYFFIRYRMLYFAYLFAYIGSYLRF